MDLYILRHAIAVERGTPGYENDFDRPITPEGEQKLRRIIKAMANLELSFDRILSSPYLRARQTAETVVNELGLRQKVELRDPLGAESNAQQIVAELIKVEPTPASLLLVGHEPSLSSTASLLISGSTTPCLSFKKAGLCKLSIDALHPGRCGRLEWLLAPRQMLLMK
jgi:phosphohistidine phosphatase